MSPLSSVTGQPLGSARQRSATQAQFAISMIKNYIIHENLQPGDPLPTETQLGAEIGVSRSSLREAIRTLVALDIVEVRHGYGMFVGQISMQPMVESLVFRGALNPGDDFRALIDIVQVRQTLDLAIAEQIIAAWQGRQDDELWALVAAMEALAAQGEAFPVQDRAFHSRLNASLENHLFGQLTDAFWDVHTLTTPLLGLPQPQDILDTAKAHRLMLLAIEDENINAYREAIGAHYEPLLTNLYRLRDSAPGERSRPSRGETPARGRATAIQ